MSETVSKPVEDRLRAIVCEHLGVLPHEVTAEARWVEDLKATSLDVIELVMAFEEEFGIEIPPDAAERLETFGQALSYLMEDKGDA